MGEPSPLQRMLAQAVRSAGLTHRELAARSGYGRSYVGAVLRGELRGSLEVWQALLDAVEVELGWRHREQGSSPVRSG